ncbi:MAG: hypothetical protein ABIP97_02610, partial [Chthoniobacterales bacterium]
MPRDFRARFVAHNRNVVFSGILTALFAALCWSLVYLFLLWLASILKTTAHADAGRIDSLVLPVFGILAAVLLILAALDHAFFRFSSMDDREIIGWHLFKEFTLVLPKL